MATQFKSKRITRVAAAKTTTLRKWTTVELQALLDKAREDASVTHGAIPRIVVVLKSAGVLHKRMLAAEIKDALEFFTWVLANWSVVANANRRSKAQQFRESKKDSTELSMTPNFNDLAYRCPYFITFFNDRKYKELAEKETVQRADTRAQVDAAARTKAIEARKKAVRQQDEEREEQRRTVAARPIPARRTRLKEVSEDDIPVFREKVWRGQ